MRHSDHDVADSLLAGPLDQQVKERYQSLAALQRKRLRPDKLFLDELLEGRGIGQSGQYPELSCLTKLHVVSGRLHTLLEPFADAKVVQVHELHADRPGVGFLETFDHLARRVEGTA